MAERCNWFWGSHGCDLPPSHDGDHLCGTEDEPCSKHNGTHVQFNAWMGAIPREEWHPNWEYKWEEAPGYCVRRRDGLGACADPDHCAHGDRRWHESLLG